MYRAVPIQNKIVDKKEKAKSIAILAERLKGVKSQIDTSAPNQFYRTTSLISNAAQQNIQDHLFKENSKILSRITDIMVGKGIPTTDSLPKLSNMTLTKAFTLDPLHFSKRKQDLIKIEKENQKFAKRISSVKSVYSAKKWEVDNNRSRLILKRMCELPYVMDKKVGLHVY